MRIVPTSDSAAPAIAASLLVLYNEWSYLLITITAKKNSYTTWPRMAEFRWLKSLITKNCLCSYTDFVYYSWLVPYI